MLLALTAVAVPNAALIVGICPALILIDFPRALMLAKWVSAAAIVPAACVMALAVDPATELSKARI